MMTRRNIASRSDYEFTYDEKQEIAKKSNGLCAHCGKRIEFGGQATVDHFVPLSKGGINRKLNTVMLCKDCNTIKTNRIVAPPNYLKYIQPKYYQEIYNYFDSYIKSFDYVSRQNLLCCDVYTIALYPEVFGQCKKKTQQKLKSMHKGGLYYDVIRAYPDDIPELEDFFIAYLERYEHLGDEETAQKNIDFWMRYGAIYFIRSNKGQIRLMMPVVMREEENGKHEAVAYIFSYYATNIDCSLVSNLTSFFMSQILSEQKIPFFKMIVVMYDNDKCAKKISNVKTQHSGDMLLNYYISSQNDNHSSAESGPDENSMPFYQAFDDVKDDMDWYLSQPENKELDFMRYDIYSKEIWKEYYTQFPEKEKAS